MQFILKSVTIDPTQPSQFVAMKNTWEQVQGHCAFYDESSSTIKVFVVYGWDETQGQTGPQGDDYQMAVLLVDGDGINTLDPNYDMVLQGLIELPDKTIKGIIFKRS